MILWIVINHGSGLISSAFLKWIYENNYFLTVITKAFSSLKNLVFTGPLETPVLIDLV